MGLPNEFRQGRRVVIGAVLNGTDEISAHDHAAVAVLLEKKEAGGPFDIRERFRGSFLKEFKPAPTHDTEMEIAKQLFVMALADSQKIEHVLIEVIQNLRLRWFL